MNAMSSKNYSKNRGGIRIETFVFIDLETTDLISRSIMPEITEISLVALSRDSLCTKKVSSQRVMHKLTIPLRPQGPISPMASELTGMNKDLLTHVKPFDAGVYELLNTFIKRLRPPVCLVAHNGNEFDYPILSAALNKIGKKLCNDILCIDTLIAFRTLLANKPTNKLQKLESSHTVKEDLLNTCDDGCDQELAAVVDLYAVSPNDEEVEVVEVKVGTDRQTMRKVNETTPTVQGNNSTNTMPRKIFNRPNGIVKKRLPLTSERPVNFKLETVYKYLVGVAPNNSHTAEDDCLSLIICATKIGESFIDWADRNAITLK